MSNGQLVSKVWNYAHVLRNQGRIATASSRDVAHYVPGTIFGPHDNPRAKRHAQTRLKMLRQGKVGRTLFRPPLCSRWHRPDPAPSYP